MRARLLLPLLAAAPLSACGSDAPPPLAGNLSETVTDSRGAHAGSFRGPDNGTGDYGIAAPAIEAGPQGRNGANTQGNTQ